jgi:glycosyltransferase involved in cell wall biosynthesis
MSRMPSWTNGILPTSVQNMDEAVVTLVAHITTVDISLRGLLLNQLLCLREAGYDVTGISSAGPAVTALEAAGVRHIPVSMTRTVSPLADLRSLVRLVHVLRREGFTIVHTHNPKPGLIGQLAARLAGVPLVVNTVHGFYFHEHMHPVKRRFFIWLERIAALCSDLILFQNQEDMDTAVRERIGRADKHRYLGNGIDLSQFDCDRVRQEAAAAKREELGLSETTRVVGFVGRLAARRKGFRDFMRACELVAESHPDVAFVIAGDADHGTPDAVEPSEFHGSPIWSRCRFLGWRPNGELPLLYSLMDVLALPSLFEGVPRAVMEAAAMGVPAVVTDVKGNREAVWNGENGLLVPLGDVQALADAICEVLTDEGEAQRMGAAGRCIAVQRFDERKVFGIVKQEYARLLAEKGLPAPMPMADEERHVS